MAEFETILTARNEMKQAIDAAIADVERLKRAQNSLGTEGVPGQLTAGQIKALTAGAKNMGTTFEQQLNKFRSGFRGVRPSVDEANNAVEKFYDVNRRGASGLDNYIGSMAARYLTVGAIIAGAVKSVTSFAASDAKLRSLAASIGTTAAHTAGLENQFKQVANTIGRSTDEVVEGFDKWRVRSGLTVEDALRSYPKVAGAAALAGAGIAEFGESFGVVVSNMKLTTDQIPAAINSFLHARRVYGVEIQDMMRSLPQLSKMFADMGYSGSSGVAMLATAVAAIQPVFRNSMRSGQALISLLSNFGGQRLLDVMNHNTYSIRQRLNELRDQGFNPLLEYIKMVDNVMQKNGGQWNEKLFPDPSDPGVQALRRMWEVWSSLPKAVRESANAVGEFEKAMATGITGSPAQRIQQLKNEFWGLAQSFGSLLDKMGATQGMKTLAEDLNSIGRTIDRIENTRFFKRVFKPEQVRTFTPIAGAIGGQIPGSSLTFKPPETGNALQRGLTHYYTKEILERNKKYIEGSTLQETKPGALGDIKPGALNVPPTPPTPEQIAAEKKRRAEYDSEAAAIARGAARMRGAARKIDRDVSQEERKAQQELKALENLPALVPQPATEVPPVTAPAPAPAAKSFWQKFRDSASSPHRRMNFEPPIGSGGERAQQASMTISTGLPVIPSDPRYRNAIVGAMIPGNSIRKRISGDAEDPEAPLRSALREMLGLPDPKEPAPWKPGGQWPHPDTATDFSGSRRRVTVLDEIMLKRQESQIKVTEDLVAEIRELNDLVKNGGGLGGGGDGGGGGGGTNRARLSGRGTRLFGRPVETTPGGAAMTYPGSGRRVSQPSAEVDAAIKEGAEAAGIDPNAMRAMASIESSMNPNSNIDKSTQYKGLFQIGRNEWRKYGQGNIYNARDNAMAAARLMSRNKSAFKKAYGRDPTGAELYLMHQQGTGFYGITESGQRTGRRTLTNATGNPYPGMRGPQTPESFEQGWTAEFNRRQQAYAGGGGQKDSGEIPSAGGGGNVRERQGDVAGIRRGQLDPRLRGVLEYASQQTGLTVDVTSGGQRMAGAPGARGSHRHDLGRAADYNLRDEKGRIVSPNDPRAIAFFKYAGIAGATGGNAGYMSDPNKIHTDIDSPGVYGKNPSGAAYRQALLEGQEARPRFLAQQKQQRTRSAQVEPETWSDMGRGKLDEDRTVNVKVNYVREVGSDGHLSKAVTDQARRAWREQADDVLGNDLYV